MAGMDVVVVACDDGGNVDLDDLRAKAGARRRPARRRSWSPTRRRTACSRRASASCARSSTTPAGRCTSTARTSTRSSASPSPASSAPTSATSTCTRRSASRTAAAARASARSRCRRTSRRSCPGHPLDGRPAGRAGVGGAVRLGGHPADLVGVHRADGRARACATRPARRSSAPTTSPPGCTTRFPVLYTGPPRPRRPRVHRRPPPDHQGDRRHRRRRRQAADGLRLPRADDELPGRRHADDRADRERDAARDRAVLRRDDRDPRRDRSGRATASGRSTRARCGWRRTPPRTCSASGTGRTRASSAPTRCRRCAPAKYFPPVSRIDAAYGDRNLICSCEPLEAYAAQSVG